MALDTERPASGGDRRGPFQSVHFGGERLEDIRKLRFLIEPDGEPMVATGRIAQTLALLIQAGARGMTSGEASIYRWARRTSDYIFRLRQMGVVVDMTLEPAGDAYIGRYTLRSRITLLPVEEARTQAA